MYEAKKRQITTVVYHLVSGPINNSHQPLLLAQDFLHACTLAIFWL